jgi:hypothetical protein
MPPPRRGGRLLTPLLLVLGSLLTALALLAGWAQWQLLDTEQWNDTSAELLEREEVRDRVADFIVDEVRTANGGTLPPELGTRLERRVSSELGSARAKRAWRAANNEAHGELVRVIEGDSGDVVTLDLDRVIRAVAIELRIPLAFLPQEIGQVTVISGDEVQSLRDATDALQRTAAFLLIAAPLMLGLAVLAASGWRMRALSGAGFAVAAAGAIVLIARALTGAYVVDALTSTRPDREAGEAVWSVATSLLATMAWVAIIGGLLLALIAALVARARPQPRLPAQSHYPGQPRYP